MSVFGVRAWGRALEQSRVRRAPALWGRAVTCDLSEQGWSKKEAHMENGPVRAVRAQDGCSGREAGREGVLSWVGTQSGEEHGTHTSCSL